jgi:hypothetical protein
VSRPSDPDLGSLVDADREILLRLALRSVAHLLGTPLQVISGHTTILARDLPGHRGLEAIARQLTQTTEALQRLVDYSAPQTIEAAESTLVAPIVDRVVQLVQARSEGLRLSYRPPSDEAIEARVIGDAFFHACFSLLLGVVHECKADTTITVALTLGTPVVPPREAGFVRDGTPMVLVDVRTAAPGEPGRSLEPSRHPWLEGAPDARPAALSLAVAAGLAREAGGFIVRHEGLPCALRLAWPVSTPGVAHQ